MHLDHVLSLALLCSPWSESYELFSSLVLMCKSEAWFDCRRVQKASRSMYGKVHLEQDEYT